MTVMSKDRELLDDFLELVADTYTSVEIVDLLDIDVWKLIAAFEDEIIEGRLKLGF